jgi:ABC-2 type transport system permease protein
MWALAEPLGYMVIYFAVFSYIVRLDIPDYPVFLLCGLISWIYFSKALVYSTEAIIKDSRLVKKIYFPREVLPIACVLSRLVNFLISLALLLIFLLFFRDINIMLLPWLALVILMQTCLSIGLALILSSLNVYFQDVKLLIDFLALIWFYLSPVFYPISMVPPKFRQLYALNPMAGILSSYKDILYYKNIPVSVEFYISIFISVLILFLGMIIFKNLNRRIGELV